MTHQTMSGRDRKLARTQAKKREILKAASRVFRRHGLQGAGMRQIAAEAGMLAGNLYYYFENKQALLAFCQEDTLAGLLDLASKVEGSGLPADQKLYLLILGHVLRLNEGTPGSLAHLEIEALEPRWADEIVPRRDVYERVLRDVVQEGIEAGIFRQVNVKTTTLAILGAVNWTVKWYRPKGSRSAAEIGHEFADYMVRGLLLPGMLFEAPDAALAALEDEPQPVTEASS
ncbi:MAG: TetR/AcrR family transcriptional regulator [Acidobacteriota bacterium]